MDKHLEDIQKAARILAKTYYGRTSQEIQSEICCMWEKIERTFSDKFTPLQTIMLVWKSHYFNEIRKASKTVKFFPLESSMPCYNWISRLMSPDEIPDLLERMNNEDVLAYIRAKYPKELEYVIDWYSLSPADKKAKGIYWELFDYKLKKIKKYCEKLIREYNE